MFRIIHSPVLETLLLLLHFVFSSLASVYGTGGDPSGIHRNDNVDGDFGYREVRVGLVLDMASIEGKIIRGSVSMALSDFYNINKRYRTKVSVLVRDSHGKPLQALAAATDLFQNAKVEAIIGGQSLLEAKLLAELGEEAKVPAISLLAPSMLSMNKYSHFIQVTHDPTSEAKGISAFVSGFDWRNLVLIYEDEDDWRESIQLLVEHFQENRIHIRYKSAFAFSSTGDYIVDQLRKFKGSGTMIFVMHMSEDLASRLFTCSHSIGMMEEGYAWILTAKTMNHVHYTNYFAKEAMKGVIGFKSYIPVSEDRYDFTLRLSRSLADEIWVDVKELSVLAIWAHDIAWSLARAAEIAKFTNTPDSEPSSNVSSLLQAIIHDRFEGFSGNIRFIDKKFLSDTFEIVNIIGRGDRTVGFWTSDSFHNRRHLSLANELETIIWPGGSAKIPKDWSLIKSGREKLRVLVTPSNRFPRLVEVHSNPETGFVTAKGFCIEVFETTIGPFNYEVEYTPWHNGSNYNTLAYELYTQKDKYDAAVGDISITGGRSLYVDFTSPFTDIGVGIVALKDKSMWLFLKPLTPALWLTSAAFFIFTGIIVWLIERPCNAEFQGSWLQQIGTMLGFGFSTLVFAHREKLKNNLSRFVVTIWVFSVLILTSSYTATLTSTMTVQQIRFNLKQNYVGFLQGSLLPNMSTFQSVKHKALNTSEQYAQALLNGSVSYIVDEIPYLKLLLGEYPTHFFMVETESTTNGFGFMFQKGSDLVHNVSGEIAKLRESGRLKDIEKRWLERQLPDTTKDMSNPLTVYKFRGLFMINGVSFAFALTVILVLWLRDNLQAFHMFVDHKLRSSRMIFARAVHPRSSIREAENAVQMVHQN